MANTVESEYYLNQPPSLIFRGLAAASCVALTAWIWNSSAINIDTGLWTAITSVRSSTTIGARQVHFAHPKDEGLSYIQKTGLQRNSQVVQSSAKISSFVLPDDAHAFLGLVAAAGVLVGVGIMASFQRASRPTYDVPEYWSIAAVAENGEELDVATLEDVGSQLHHLPPYASDKPFRPDLFQPQGKVGTVIFTDIPYVKTRNYFLNRKYNKKDILFATVLLSMHIIAFTLGPMTYRPDCLALMLGLYAITGLGITFSYHRQLSHKAFTTPKWLEYLMAYCGVQALEGAPAEWVTTHRYHHMYQETDRDPHTINEGLWWSHMGWLLDNEATQARVADRSISGDIVNDPFYKFIEKTYIFHPILLACALFAWGGLPYLVWGMAVRIVWVWHITWLVNGASHSWGTKKYKTNPPDESRNNWWVGLLALGEGWHNNHHAFQYSARLGLEWWQVDITWYVISFLRVLGLAKNVKLPTEARKKAMLLTN